uniref:DUF1800 domain-containing protein n=1 Tax=Thiomonas intermedia (strain K12) TaxID=75379 RepID=D5X1Q8_THIK1
MEHCLHAAGRLSRRRFIGGFGVAGLGLWGLSPAALSQTLQTASEAGPAALDAAAQADPVTFLDRVSWGASAEQLQALSRLGATAYLDLQLRVQPGAALPSELAARLAALPVNQPLQALIPPIVREQRALFQARKNDPQAAADTEARLKALNRFKYALAQQAAAQQVWLGLYAPNALQQRLSWFWLNHFNVFRSGNIGPMMGDYTQRVIAPHALGRFRDLLRATMFSPQMLLYLNNAQNARGHVNENYAREVMELHTLGVGSGYTQTDVTNLARALTGLGVDLMDQPVRVRPALRADVWRQGLVVFNPARHDPDPKTVLGYTLEGHGLEEIDEVITLLADHPATARHVSTQLAQYFVADPAPPALVDDMVRRWQTSGGADGRSAARDVHQRSIRRQSGPAAVQRPDALCAVGAARQPGRRTDPQPAAGARHARPPGRTAVRTPDARRLPVERERLGRLGPAHRALRSGAADRQWRAGDVRAAACLPAAERAAGDRRT